MNNEIVEIDRYKPDYKHGCCNCEATPVVTAIKDEKVVYSTGMCGPCTWGEADAIDPDTWNT